MQKTRGAMAGFKSIKMSRPSSKQVQGCLKTNSLTLATMTGVIVGVILGAVLNAQNTEDDKWTPRQVGRKRILLFKCRNVSYFIPCFMPIQVMYVSYVGKLFLRMLKCIIIPLIIPSLIASVGSLDLSLSGKVGGRAVAYYMVTTVLAVILGIILVSSVRKC